MTPTEIESSNIAVRTVAFKNALPAAIDLEHGDGVPANVVTAIRRDLKAAVAAGLIPAHAKFSVRREDYNSIFVDLIAWSGQILNTEYHAHVMAMHISKIDARLAAPREFVPECREPGRVNEGCDGRLSDEVNRVMRLVGFLVNRHNYDNSDSQRDHFDVGFYQHISARHMISAAEQGVALEFDSELAELVRGAHVAANRLGKACTKSFIGRGQIEAAGEYTLNSLIRVDQRINGLCYLDIAMLALFGGEHAGLWAVAIRIAEIAAWPAVYNKHRNRWDREKWVANDAH